MLSKKTFITPPTLAQVEYITLWLLSFFGNILQRGNPYLGRYRALGALADTSLWGIPALITWSGYNWGSISSNIKQLVIGSL